MVERRASKLHSPLWTARRRGAARWLPCAALWAAALLAAPAAEAGFGASVHAQYGIGLNAGEGQPTGYGLGVGGRAGFTFGFGLYTGALVDYYLGETVGEGPLEASNNVFNVAAETGFDFSLPVLPLTVRPRIGLGLLVQSLDVGIASTSGDSFVVMPGVSVLYDLGPFLHAGLEGTVVVPTESLETNEKALTVGLSFGARF